MKNSANFHQEKPKIKLCMVASVFDFAKHRTRVIAIFMSFYLLVYYNILCFCCIFLFYCIVFGIGKKFRHKCFSVLFLFLLIAGRHYNVRCMYFICSSVCVCVICMCTCVYGVQIDSRENMMD